METDNEKRRRFDALAPPDVSSGWVQNIERGNGFARRVINRLQHKGILGKKYTNKDTDWDNIEMNNMSVRNVIRHDGRNGKVAILEVTPQIIKDGIFLESIPKSDGLDSHVFAAKATLDDVPYAVCYLIREDKNGRRYYDHSLTEIEELDRLRNQAPDVDSAQRDLHEHQGEEQLSLSNILKKHLGVNSEAKKVSTACG